MTASSQAENTTTSLNTPFSDEHPQGASDQIESYANIDNENQLVNDNQLATGRLTRDQILRIRHRERVNRRRAERHASNNNGRSQASTEVRPGAEMVQERPVMGSVQGTGAGLTPRRVEALRRIEAFTGTRPAALAMHEAAAPAPPGNRDSPRSAYTAQKYMREQGEEEKRKKRDEIAMVRLVEHALGSSQERQASDALEEMRNNTPKRRRTVKGV